MAAPFCTNVKDQTPDHAKPSLAASRSSRITFNPGEPEPPFPSVANCLKSSDDGHACVNVLPDAETILAKLPDWTQDYCQVHPHSGLKFPSRGTSSAGVRNPARQVSGQTGCTSRSEVPDVSVSIVIPVKNCVRFIGEAIASALAQVEVQRVIVVDDGSTDGSLHVAEKFSDDRLVVISGRGNGVSAARNIGFREAEARDPCSGESPSWVSFLDADDRLRPRAIATLLEGVNGDCVAVYGNYDRIDEEGETIGRRQLLGWRRKPSGDILPILLAGNFIVNGGVMIIRRDIFRCVGGFDEMLRFCEDWHIFCRIAARGPVLWRPNANVLGYRIHHASAMMSRSVDFSEYRPALERVFSDPLVMSKVNAMDTARLRREAEAHLRTYLACQAIRAHTYLRAIHLATRAVAALPSRAPKTMLHLLGAMAAL